MEYSVKDWLYKASLISVGVVVGFLAMWLIVRVFG